MSSAAVVIGALRVKLFSALCTVIFNTLVHWFSIVKHKMFSFQNIFVTFLIVRLIYFEIVKYCTNKNGFEVSIALH